MAKLKKTENRVTTHDRSTKQAHKPLYTGFELSDQLGCQQ